ncbi:sugar phosphate isomerase/epimerase family protein [Salinisphaera hydrothermalis]|uniref:sugar phosphate isomerase/epimerase family protein n=1 Tax=Salinisphaera hydrothermalis TaxID=563188 RepID=UPI003341C1F1
MKIGMVTDSVAHMDIDAMLDYCAELGIDAIEFCVGNWGAAAHIGDVKMLLEDSARQRELAAKIRDRGLEISAFTANGNQLHPTDGERQSTVVHNAIRLAEIFEVPRIVLMSGLPAGAPGDSMPNWVTTAWPPETHDILRYQWEDVAIPYWRKLVDYAEGRGVNQLCIEAHGAQLVHNMPSFMRLRDAVGPTVGLNFDPSHFIWMGGDPIEMIRRYADCIYHVHAKDTYIDQHNLAEATRLDTRPMDRVLDRSWSYVTLGYGQPEDWWREFCWQLQARGYSEGVLSIEHEDQNLSCNEGVRRSVDLLRRVMPQEQPDYQLPD